MVSCKEYSEIVKNKIRCRINTGKPPCLVVLQVGNDPASCSYIKGKKKDCEEVGIKCIHIPISINITEEELIQYIKDVGETCGADGIIVQLPLPKHINAERIKNAIPKEKDVDGFRRDSLFKPCTPKGIIDWFKYNNVKLEGKDVCVIGRSDIVGKPLVNMLIDEGATVTCCNSKTQELDFFTKSSEIVISAVGKPKIFNDSYFRLADIIVDVGINRDEDGKLCGDIDTTGFNEYFSVPYVTPVPGGVGLLTRATLLKNVMEAYERNGQSENRNLS